MGDKKLWGEWRANGIAIRAKYAKTQEARGVILGRYNTGAAEKKMIDSGMAWVNRNLTIENSNNKAVLVPIAEKAALNAMGPAGILALCDLPALKITKPAEVVMLFVHAMITSSTLNGVKVLCIGSDEDDKAWNPAEEWPNIIPASFGNGGNFSFRYELSGGGRELVVNSKAIVMGDLIVLTVAHGSDAFTVQVTISDFVTAKADDIDKSINELTKGSIGIYNVLSRAACASLNDIVVTKIVTPLLDKLGMSLAKPEPEPRHQNPLHNNPRINPMTNPVPMPMIGQDDLNPPFGGGLGRGPLLGGGIGGGNGGSLFGPGNPNFGGGLRGPGRAPPGVPPGARYDPYGPGTGGPRPRPGGGRGRGGGGAGFGGGFGGVGPDHLRPPNYDDDDNNMYM